MNQDAGKPADKPMGNTTSPEPVSTAVIITDPNTGQNIEDAEIRRQVEVKIKRNWKELAVEFLLILAAVSLGFFADSIREKWEDRQKEKKYMRSLVDDLEIDRMISDTLYDKVGKQSARLDSLEWLLLEADLNDPVVVKQCYELATAFTYYPDFYIEGTITQLLSSGSMRLIKNQEIASQVMLYHGQIKFMEAIKQAYMTTMVDCYKSHHEIFDVLFLLTKPDKKGVLNHYHTDRMNMSLMNFNDDQLRRFVTLLERAKAQAAYYAGQYKIMIEESERLNEIIRDEYNIKRLKESD